MKEAKAIRGIPDLLIVLNGKFAALEVKKDLTGTRRMTGRTVLQRYVLAKMRKAGAFAEFICPENEDEIIARLVEYAFPNNGTL